MRPRDVLAANLKALMAARPDLSTLEQITAVGGGSNGKLGRIRSKSAATDIDSLGILAHVFGLKPWQMLVEGFDPKTPPVLTTEARAVEEPAQLSEDQISEMIFGMAEASAAAINAAFPSQAERKKIAAAVAAKAGEKRTFRSAYAHTLNGLLTSTKADQPTPEQLAQVVSRLRADQALQKP